MENVAYIHEYEYKYIYIYINLCINIYIYLYVPMSFATLVFFFATEGSQLYLKTAGDFLFTVHSMDFWRESVPLIFAQ